MLSPVESKTMLPPPAEALLHTSMTCPSGNRYTEPLFSGLSVTVALLAGANMNHLSPCDLTVYEPVLTLPVGAETPSVNSRLLTTDVSVFS